MVTVLLIVLGLIAVIGIVGGVSMMFNGGGFWSWYMGYHAMAAGLDILGWILLAVAEGLAEAAKG